MARLIIYFQQSMDSIRIKDESFLSKFSLKEITNSIDITLLALFVLQEHLCKTYLVVSHLNVLEIISNFGCFSAL